MDPGTSEDLDAAVAAISATTALALACHVGPDGDALGSMLALHHLARSQGVTSVASWSEPFVVAPHYRYLPGLDLTSPPATFPEAPAVMVTFDCGSLQRLGDLAEPAKAAGQLVVVDHHASNDRFGSINVVDVDAAATAVIVREMARRLDWPLTHEAALCLYTGLVTDTGRFQYDNTTPEVFELARELATYDLPIAEVTRQLFEEHSFRYLKMVGACLSRAELDRELGFVATWVTNFDLDGFDVSIEETEGLIDLVRRTAEAEVACVCKETAEGIRVSLRSVSDVDVAAVAARFGGGGHRYAAGFVAPYPVTRVLASIRSALAEQREVQSQQLA